MTEHLDAHHPWVSQRTRSWLVGGPEWSWSAWSPAVIR